MVLQRFFRFQAFRKTLCEIERLQSAEMGFNIMLVPFCKHLQESLSTPAALELPMFVIIFKTFFSEVLLKQISFSSIALKLEITLLFCIPRDLRDSQNFLGLPIVSESFSSKKGLLFYAISFKAACLRFSYNSLSIWSLDFFNFLKGLFIRFTFSNTSTSTHFWVFPFARLLL